MLLKRMSLLSCSVLIAVGIVLMGINPVQAEMVKKVDGFELLVDMSGSLDKFQMQKDFLQQLNEVLPELGYTGGMRVFGFTNLISGPSSYSKGVWGAEIFSKAKLGEAIAPLAGTTGITPLGPAMEASQQELGNMGPRKALIIISDFKRSVDFGDPAAEANKLKAAYAHGLCIYPVVFEGDAESMALAEAVSDVTGCAKPVNAADLLSSPGGVQAWAKNIFWEEKEEPKPAPPAPTPKTVTISLHVKFATAKAVVKPEYRTQIEEVAVFMTKNADTKAVIEGHTDSVGKDAYNQKLSQQRAEAVRDYLVSEFGIDAARLTAVGYGETRPVADNKTEEGRQQNRRVDCVITGTIME